MHSSTNVTGYNVVKMKECCELSEPINLIKMNDTAYVWNSQDWLKLRSLRIVGCLVGNLATLAKQDRIAALPMSLLKEETTLLLEKGYAVLKVPLSISRPPNAELCRKSEEHREKILSEQAEILKNERKREINSKIDVIIEGKRAKLGRSSGTSILSTGNISAEEILKEEYQKIYDSKDLNFFTQICTRDPWINEEDLTVCDWEPLEKNDIKYLTFKDLWEKGYYITLGEKFGGDFLAYPGDPIKYHAFFIVLCLKRNANLTMQQLITYGRLGQSVKKTVVFSYLNELNQLSYHSLQWAGF